VDRLRERADAGGRTVLLSGDVHSSWAFVGPVHEATGEPVAVEWTTPAVSSAAMGRAHYPGLWRILDRAADALDHVAWSDVTNRGYTVVEITPEAVRSDFWFVHPYADDPGGTAEHAAALTTSFDEWPPRLRPLGGGASPDPERPGLPGDLPPRPADLRRSRRRRTARITAEATASFLVTAAVAGGVVRALRGSGRAGGRSTR
jgi:hypothetical protein